MCQIVNNYPINWPQRRMYGFVLHRNQNAIHWPIIGMNHFNQLKSENWNLFWISMFADCKWGGWKVEKGFEHASLLHRHVSTFDSSNTDFFFLIFSCFQISTFKLQNIELRSVCIHHHWASVTTVMCFGDLWPSWQSDSFRLGWRGFDSYRRRPLGVAVWLRS
jgi:hypothetical protein